jgi:hypothetical protein
MLLILEAIQIQKTPQEIVQIEIQTQIVAEATPEEIHQTVDLVVLEVVLIETVGLAAIEEDIQEEVAPIKVETANQAATEDYQIEVDLTEIETKEQEAIEDPQIEVDLTEIETKEQEAIEDPQIEVSLTEIETAVHLVIEVSLGEVVLETKDLVVIEDFLEEVVPEMKDLVEIVVFQEEGALIETEAKDRGVIEVSLVEGALLETETKDLVAIEVSLVEGARTETETKDLAEMVDFREELVLETKELAEIEKEGNLKTQDKIRKKGILDELRWIKEKQRNLVFKKKSVQEKADQH